MRLLAILLLVLPPDTPTPALPPAAFPAVAPALREVCLENELLDPREVAYLLARPEDLGSDLTLLRRRLRNLAGAPPASDCQRFPGREVVIDLLEFNRRYRDRLTALQAVQPARWWELQEAVRETDRLYQVYQAVRDSRTDYYYVTHRREALKKVLEMIGPDAYYTGQLPPNVPVWLFRRAD